MAPTGSARVGRAKRAFEGPEQEQRRRPRLVRLRPTRRAVFSGSRASSGPQCEGQPRLAARFREVREMLVKKRLEQVEGQVGLDFIRTWLEGRMGTRVKTEEDAQPSVPVQPLPKRLLRMRVRVPMQHSEAQTLIPSLAQICAATASADATARK